MNNFRIFDLLSRYAEKFPKEDALSSKMDGKWVKISTTEFIENANNISYGLLAMGMQKGDKIATISNNRFEWNFLDMGMLQIGCVHVPIYPTISEAEYKFILNDAEVKYIFVSDKELYEKIQHIKGDVATVKDVYTFNKVEGAKHWSEVAELGKQNPQAEKVEGIKKEIQAAELATLIYTSGTTGMPKGVMLSHNNLMSNVISVQHLPPVDETCRALSFLPINHVYERMITYLYMFLGVSIYYAESIEHIADNLKEVHPEAFTTVPRLLEKVYDKIVAKGTELTGIKKALFFWALDLGLKFELDNKNGWWYAQKLKLANKLIFSKWREALGGNVRAIVSGSAALQPRLARVFWAAGIYVLEGYGLTETSPVIAVNNLDPGGAHFGTVGPVIEGVTVKIAEDGEILCKGPNVMMGYYKRQDLTDEVIDKDGWFHTGDIGILLEGKYLKITDRKKEIFKTSGGKYVAPQPVENKFKESNFIEQIMVVGEGQKFTGALIVPAFAFLQDWCKEKGIAFTNPADMIKNKQIIDRYRKEVEKLNQNFGHIEQIKKFELLPDEWTVDSGELTPTLKLKRKIITAKYRKVIAGIYGVAEDEIK